MSKNHQLTILGMMSGTSMDGIDCLIANVKISNEQNLTFEIIEQNTFPIPKLIRDQITSVIENPQNNYNDLHNELGEFYNLCCLKLKNTKMLDLISIHGQTIYHEERVKSIQIGSPASLNKQFKIPVIHNFRLKDIELNGTGAPLMPFLDWLLLKDSKKIDITLNIGGIANVTIVPKNGARDNIIGFDTGPGMALIDECCLEFWKKPFDKNGEISKNGIINEDILDYLMHHPFIKENYPKSTGRDVFGKLMVLDIIKKFNDEKPQNLLRTFIAFTVNSISENLYNIRNFSPLESRLLLSGGGINHPILMDELKRITQIKQIEKSDILGIHPDYKEALLMAVLGYTHYYKMPNNMPSVTGAIKKVVLGETYYPNKT